MRRLFFGIVATVAATSLVMIAGCASATPAPSPTKAAEPTKAAAAQPAPTKAVEAAKPTEVPAKKVDWPQKGKTITIICPMPAGGAMDVAARVVAAALEKDLGTPVQVVNKAGAGGQVGLTELFGSKPDGYTISAMALPATIVMYLDKERKAAFTGLSDFVPLGLDNAEPVVLAVPTDSPYKTAKDLVEAAKAKPGQIKASVSGVLVVPHLGSLDFMRAAGIKLGLVHFEGGPPAVAAMLGGHTALDFEFTGSLWPAIKGGNARVLAVLDKKEYKPLPGVPTAESQGYKSYMTVARGYVAPKGTPKEVADVLSAALKKAVTTPEYAKKLEELGMQANYMSPAQMSDFWSGQESQVVPLIEQAKADAVKK
ncbi:MAG: Bug family tripartite tricarboxylate transporter substrate binding protein [Chloroflexota bacterium]